MFCSVRGPVCGRDYQEYHSECAAHSNNVLVDHYSPCNRTTTECIRMDHCPLEYQHQIPFNRCPFCGSVAYFVYDINYFERITNKIDSDHIKRYLVEHGKLNLKTLHHQLEEMVLFDKCYLYAHLITPGYLAVLLDSKYDSNKTVSNNYRRICRLELERIIKIISSGSPLTQLRFPLSLLHYHEPIEQKIRTSNLKLTSFNGTTKVKLNNLILLLLFYVMARVNNAFFS